MTRPAFESQLPRRRPLWSRLVRAVVVVLLVARPLVGQEPELNLDWSAPPECPSEEQFRARIRELSSASSAGPRALEVQAIISRRGEGFVMELSLSEQGLTSEREFTGRTCEEVSGAAAVAIAVLLHSLPGEGQSSTAISGADALEVDGEDESSRKAAEASANLGAGSEEAGAENRQEERQRARAQRARERRQRRAAGGPLWFAALPGLALESGVLPAPSVAVGVGFGVDLPAYRFALQGLYDFGQTSQVQSVPDGEIHLGRQVLRAFACRWLGAQRVRLAPCATVAFNHLIARAAGGELTPGEANTAWLGLGVGGVGRLRVTDWMGISLALTLELQTAQPVLVIDGVGEVEQLGILQLGSSINAEWIF